MRKNSASQSGLFNPRVLLAFALCSAGGLVGPPTSASAPVTTSATDATALKLSSGHNVLALYRTSNQVTGHVDPGTRLPGVRVAPSDFPDAFRGLWGPDDGEFGAWLSPSGFLQYSPSSFYVNSSYMTNSMRPAEAPPLEKTGSLPIEAGDHFDIVMGDVVGNAPLPGDLQRGAANGQLAWDYAASTQHLTASYSGVSGAADALFFRADVVARGGDVDARLTQMQTPPLVIDLPPGASTGTVAFTVNAVFPYTYYIVKFVFRVVPNTNTAVLTASVSGYIPEAREYELPLGGQMNEWHLPIVGVVTVNPAGAGQTQGVAFMRAAGDALVNASGAGTTQTLHVHAGSSVVAGGKLSPTVLEPALGDSRPNKQVAPALPANAGGLSASTEDLGVPRDQAKLTREFAAAEPIGPLTTTPAELTVAGGRYSLTLDPDYRGEGILALSAVKRSADGAVISALSSVPFVLLDGQPVPLDRSRLTDLRVIPTQLAFSFDTTSGGGGPSPTTTIQNDSAGDIVSGAHVNAVYDLGLGRYAFLTFKLGKSFVFEFGNIDVIATSVVRSLSGDPVQASPIQYGELPEVGPVIYDGTTRDSEFSAPLDFRGDHTSLEVGDHLILASLLGSPGQDGIITVLIAPAPLTPEPVADPATSIDNQRLAYFYASSDFPTNFSLITTRLTAAVRGSPAPPPLGQSCAPPQVVETVPDAPPALDIEKAWFDSDAINLYASIQVADLPQAAPADTGYSWTLNWRYNDFTWLARASLDSDGNWSFNYEGFADVTGETKPGPHGVMRITIPRWLFDVVDGDLLRDTGAHSYVVSQGRSEEVDQAPNGAGPDFGSGGDYVVGPSCVLPLVSVVSRKAHGPAGTFDINLPLIGSPGIECRSGGSNGDYTMVFTFGNPLASVGGASVTSGTGSVSDTSIDSNDAHNYIVNLTGVANAQVITVSLANVTDSAGNSSSSVPSPSMGVLLGDTSANGLVNSTDISQTQAQSGQVVTGSNFRTDVNVNGLINSTDISIVQSKSGAGLP